MSLQMLLTLGVAGGIWVSGALLYLLIKGAIRLGRLATGRPARRPEGQPVEEPLPGEVIGRGPTPGERMQWLGRVLGRLGDGTTALIMFLVATVTSVTARVASIFWRLVSRWWREAAQPSLVEARDLGIDRITIHPESSGRLDLLAHASRVLLDEELVVSGEDEREPEMQLV